MGDILGKLILIMIDGISADHFERSRGDLPHLNHLAGRGTQVAGVSPEMCGTSSPGRTSIVTGVPAAEHSIYGNRIFDGHGFRWANPYDVQGETLPALASRQGRDVAGIGYGMVRPEDCGVYHGPWWTGEMLTRGRNADWKAADARWHHSGEINDAADRIKALFDAGLGKPVVEPGEHGDLKFQMGVLADHQLMDIAAGLACSDQPPDLILLEIAVTDYYLHRYGTDHPLTEWSLRAADAQVGTLLARLETRGVLTEYNFAVLSDHGHANIRGGFYVDRVLGQDAVWSSEGGVLMVVPQSTEQAGWIRKTLASHDIEEWDNMHLPTDLRDSMLTFVMPEDADMSFEASRPDTTGITGPSKYRSNHGMRPGTRADYRFCIFNGPDIPRRIIPSGEAMQVAPTLAKVLGIECPWTGPAWL